MASKRKTRVAKMNFGVKKVPSISDQPLQLNAEGYSSSGANSQFVDTVKVGTDVQSQGGVDSSLLNSSILSQKFQGTSNLYSSRSISDIMQKYKAESSKMKGGEGGGGDSTVGGKTTKVTCAWHSKFPNALMTDLPLSHSQKIFFL